MFGANNYEPETVPGRALLWHELTHVVQQAGRAALRGAPIPIADDGPAAASAERQARDVGTGMASPARYGLATASPVLQRQQPEDESKIRGIDADDEKIRASLGFAPRVQTGITWLGGRPDWLKADADQDVHWLGQSVSPSLKAAVAAEFHKAPAPRARPQQPKPVPKSDAGGSTQVGQIVPRPPGLPVDQGFTLIPATELNPQVAGSMSAGLKVIKYGGRVFPVVGIVASAYEIATATKESGHG